MARRRFRRFSGLFAKLDWAPPIMRFSSPNLVGFRRFLDLFRQTNPGFRRLRSLFRQTNPGFRHFLNYSAKQLFQQQKKSVLASLFLPTYYIKPLLKTCIFYNDNEWKRLNRVRAYSPLRHYRRN